ncbi:MAG: ABC transporter permease subunit [Polyangiaceae bacterium]|nr:ABC transporter permease subunit [Polyangiaceae bacterium]
MRARPVALIAGREVRASVRARWFTVGAVSLALLAIAAAELGMAGAARWGVSALDRTSAALLNLVLLFVPLLTLPLGAGAFSGEAEDGTLAYLLSQPVTRGEVFAGKLLGLLATTTLSVLFGFGVAAAVVGLTGGVPTATFGALVFGAWLLAMVTVTIGALLSVAARTRVKALAAAVGAWIVLVFLCDFGVLALAASQSVGPQALFAVAVANPLQAVKTLSALAISERLEVLGPIGVYAVRTLGRGLLSALLVGSTGLWIAAAAAGGLALFRRQSFT